MHVRALAARGSGGIGHTKIRNWYTAINVSLCRPLLIQPFSFRVGQRVNRSPFVVSNWNLWQKVLLSGLSYVVFIITHVDDQVSLVVQRGVVCLCDWLNRLEFTAKNIKPLIQQRDLTSWYGTSRGVAAICYGQIWVRILCKMWNLFQLYAERRG